MQSKYLFPHRLKKYGWVVLIPSLLFGLFVVITDYEPSFLNFRVPTVYIDSLFSEGRWFGLIEDNILNELLGAFFIISALLVAFSKTRVEDEYISHIRESSLVWSVYVNYIILLVALVFLHEFSFYWVMLFNMFSLLLIFIIRFHLYVIILSNKSSK